MNTNSICGEIAKYIPVCQPGYVFDFWIHMIVHHKRPIVCEHKYCLRSIDKKGGRWSPTCVHPSDTCIQTPAPVCQFPIQFVCLSVCLSDSHHSLSVCDHHPICVIRKAQGGPGAKNSFLMDWERSTERFRCCGTPVSHDALATERC